MISRYSLNEQTLKFIIEYEKNVKVGEKFTTKDLVNLFNKSSFNKDQFDTYSEHAKNKSIWWAVTRSGKWLKSRPGEYTKNNSVVTEISVVNKKDPKLSKKVTAGNRKEYIKFLAENLFEVLLLKRQISDTYLRSFSLTSKGVGDDLYYLTVSYYKQRGVYKRKHSITDFITPKAKAILDSGEKLSNKLKYEHMIPKNIYIKRIAEATITNNITIDFIYDILVKYYYTCTVTTDEDRLLPQTRMPKEWDEENPFYRYEDIGIFFSHNVGLIMD